MNIVDLVIIALIGLGGLTGYRRGLIASLAGLVSNIIGFFTALKYYPLLAAWANADFNLNQRLLVFFQTHIALPVPVMEFRLDRVPLPELGNYLDRVNLPLVLKTQLLGYYQSMEAGLQLQARLGDIINQFLANALVNAGSLLFIWFFVNLVIMLLAALISSLINNTFIVGFNRGGGLLTGGIISAFILTIIIGLASPLVHVTNLAEPGLFSAIFKTMAESRLLPYFLKAFNLLAEKITAFWL